MLVMNGGILYFPNMPSWCACLLVFTASYTNEVIFLHKRDPSLDNDDDDENDV
jgi:hypothetical protein